VLAVRRNRSNVLPIEKEVSCDGVSGLERLKQLEDENQCLKELMADRSLDKHILQEVPAKKSEALMSARVGQLANSRVPSQSTAAEQTSAV